MAYQTTYNAQGQPSGSTWVNEGQTLADALQQSQATAGWYSKDPIFMATGGQGLIQQAPQPQSYANPSTTSNSGSTSLQDATNTSIWPTTSGTIQLKGPSGDVISVDGNDYMAVNAKTRAGYVPYNSTTGASSKVTDYMGGQMFQDPATGKWVPLNVLLGGDWQQNQSAALPDFLRSLTTGTPPPTAGVPPNVPSPPVDTSGNWQDILNALIAQAGLVGNNAATAFSGFNKTLTNFLNYNQTQASNQLASQQDLIRQLMGQVNPAIQSAIDNQNTGLTPEAMAALRTQALEQVPANFNRMEEQIRTELMRRGALGGDLPASAGDYVRELGGLDAQKEALRAGLLSQATLADQSALQQNRANALNAAGLTNSLLGTAGGLESPNAFLGSANQTLNTMLGGVGGQAGAQLQALGVQATLGNSLATNSPESLKSILLAGLLGTAGKNIPGIVSGIEKVISDVFKKPTKDPVTGEVIAGSTGALGSISSAQLTAFFTNPITIAVGAGILATVAWLKSQAHWEANTFVKDFQNPFFSADHSGQVNRIVDSLWQAYGSGQLTKEQATSTKDMLQSLYTAWVDKANKWAGGSSDKTTVATQGISTVKGYFDKVIADLDSVIPQLT